MSRPGIPRDRPAGRVPAAPHPCARPDPPAANPTNVLPGWAPPDQAPEYRLPAREFAIVPYGGRPRTAAAPGHGGPGGARWRAGPGGCIVGRPRSLPALL